MVLRRPWCTLEFTLVAYYPGSSRERAVSRDNIMIFILYFYFILYIPLRQRRGWNCLPGYVISLVGVGLLVTGVSMGLVRSFFVGDGHRLLTMR